MASNIEKLGGYIKDKAVSGAQNFAFGAKAAFYSGNPAMFGAIESGISNLKKSFNESKENESKQFRREQAEQRRQRGFQEEQAREQRYNELQQQKIFESMDENIKKILEFLTKQKEKDSIFDDLLKALAGLSLAVPKIVVKGLKNLSVLRPKWLDDLKLKRPFWLDDFKGRPKWLDDFKGRPKWVDDFKGVKGRPKWLDGPNGRPKWVDDLYIKKLPKPSWVDDLYTKGVPESRLSRLPQGTAGALLAPRATRNLAQLVDDAEFETSKQREQRLNREALKRQQRGLPPVPEGADDLLKGISLASNSRQEISFLGKFINEIKILFESLKPALNGLKEFFGPELKVLQALGPKIAKAIPGIGILISGIEGIMNAFDTEKLEELFGKNRVGFSERVGGFVGGVIGSVFGLADLVLMLFGIETKKSVQESFTDFFTENIGKILRLFQDIFLSVGATAEVIYGTLTGDDERFETGMSKLTFLHEKYKTFFLNQAEQWGDVITHLMDSAGAWMTWAKDSILAVMNRFFEGFELVITNMRAGIVSDIINPIAKLSVDASAKIKSAGVYIMNSVYKVVDSVINGIVWLINQAIDGFNFLAPKGYEVSRITYESKLASTPAEIDAKIAKIESEAANTKVALDAATSQIVAEAEAKTKAFQETSVSTTLDGISKIRDASIEAALTTYNQSNAETQENIAKRNANVQRLGEEAGQYDKESETGTGTPPVGLLQTNDQPVNLAPQLETGPTAGIQSAVVGKLDDIKVPMDNVDVNVAKILRILNGETSISTDSGGPLTPEEQQLLYQKELECRPPEPPKEEQPPTLKDTEDQKTEIIESNKEGAEEIVDNAAAISESEKAAEDARHAVSMEAAAANYRLQEALNAKLNGWLSQQNEMVRALFGLLGRGGGEGGGFLGKISGLFKGDGPLKGVGDFLGNVFGKGSGGWFDKASGWFGGLKDAFGEITDTFGGVGGALEELLGGGSGGTMIFNTPGFGGPMSTGNPFMDILGGGISEKLGLSGVGTNAVADLARNFMSSSPQSFGSVLKGQGGIGGGIGSIMTLKNADINTLGGAVSGGLALYQLHKGGGLGNMVIDGVNKFAEKLLENNAESIIGNKLKSFMSGKMGTVVKKFGGAFQAYATAEFLSGGYAVNKHLNKIAAVVSMIPGVGQIAGVVAGVVNRLFGRKPKEYKDYGLDLNMGAQTTGQQYKDWVKKGGVYRSDKKGTDYENLDQEMLDGLSQAAVSVQEGYGALAEVMGMSAESIKGFTKDYKISLKDLSPEEQQKKIAELIQTYAKDAIKASYGNVSRYSLQGEDTLKTFERLASATESVSYWFDALGYSVEETTDMFKRAGENLTSGGSGNIAGDLFNVDWTTSDFYRKAMMGGREGALAQYNEFMAGGMYDMSNFVGPYGPMNWMSGYYTPELSEEQKKNQEALALAGAKANFVQMVGGDEQFAQAMQSYFTGFYSQEEQAEFMARQATKMAQAQLEAVQDQIAQLTNQFEGIDPNLAQKLEGITSREQIEEAKAEYRKAIEAAMESGDMELAAELLKSAEIFVQAGEMQLEAARLRGEAKGGFDISDYQIGVAAVGSAFGINIGAGGIAEDNPWLADQIVEAIPFMEESSATVTPADAQSTSTADVNSVVAADNSVTNTVVNNNAPAAFDPTLLNLREFHPVLSGGLRGIPFGFNINITGM